MSRHADALTNTEVVHLQFSASWLSHICYMRMGQFLQNKPTPASSAKLTAQEREVLRWTGEGKTSYEVVKILNISERSVNFHVNSALARLAATNKVQAVVKAIVTGII